MTETFWRMLLYRAQSRTCGLVDETTFMSLQLYCNGLPIDASSTDILAVWFIQEDIWPNSRILYRFLTIIYIIKKQKQQANAVLSIQSQFIAKYWYIMMIQCRMFILSIVLFCYLGDINSIKPTRQVNVMRSTKFLYLYFSTCQPVCMVVWKRCCSY